MNLFPVFPEHKTAVESEVNQPLSERITFTPRTEPAWKFVLIAPVICISGGFLAVATQMYIVHL